MTHSVSTRFAKDVSILCDLWRTLLDSQISATQMDFWLSKYGAAATVFAIRRTFTVFVKNGTKVDDTDHKERYCAAAARNYVVKNAPAVTA
jgi:hypothetical protein